MSDIIRIDSISEMTKGMGLPEPKHPLVYVVDVTKFKTPEELKGQKVMAGFYTVFLKDADCGMTYGRNRYDFDEGVLSFYAPGQVVSSDGDQESTYGWGLAFHPDLIRKSNLGLTIDDYHFFSYDVHEALHLSKKEEDILQDCINKIEFELDQNIDGHSQQLLISNIELLLNYCNRFYERQFHTRSDHHKDVVSSIEKEIKAYFESNEQINAGLPTTKYLADKVNLSPKLPGRFIEEGNWQAY